MNNVKLELELGLSQLNAQQLQLLITAYRWGYEDGAAGRPLHGSNFFEVAAPKRHPAWQTYNDRYQQGLQTRQPTTPRSRTKLPSCTKSLTAYAPAQHQSHTSLPNRSRRLNVNALARTLASIPSGINQGGIRP